MHTPVGLESRFSGSLTRSGEMIAKSLIPLEIERHLLPIDGSWPGIHHREMAGFRDILAPIMGDFVHQLLRHGGRRTQRKLGDAMGVDANTISRYKSGKVVPQKNFVKLGQAAGLEPESTAWLIGSLLVAEYQAHSFELARTDGEASPEEVREGAPAYGSSLSQDLQEVLAIDLSDVDPGLTFELHRERDALRGACEDLLAGHPNLVAYLRSQLADLKERCQAAVRQAPRRRR